MCVWIPKPSFTSFRLITFMNINMVWRLLLFASFLNVTGKSLLIIHTERGILLRTTWLTWVTDFLWVFTQFLLMIVI
ncbi:hypothetical protein LINPERHAP2_LOCUS9765 [Linum perenne]